MTYPECIEQIKKQAHEELGFPLEKMKFYPAGFTSDDPKMIEWIKDCNLKFMGEENTTLLTDFLTIEVPEAGHYSSIHRIAIRRMHEGAEKNGFDSVFKDIRSMQKDMEAAQIDRSRLDDRSAADYEVIRKQLILRPLNYGLHIQDLHGCVYGKMSDFVLALYQILGDSNHSLVTSKIKRDELKRWGMEDQEDKVMRDALENTARLYPACVYDQRTQREADFLEGEFTKEDITFLDQYILLTTFKTNNGAVSLFYPGVIEKMMKIMGGPFVAVFMNVNDVMIFDKEKKDSLAVMFADTAKKSSKMGEMLSGKTYLCDGKQFIPGIVVKVFQDGKVTVE